MIHSPRDYAAYGLSIRSSLALPFVSFPGPPTGEADVRISFGRVPATIQNPIIRRPSWEAAEGILLMNVPGVAKYSAVGGRDVTVETYNGDYSNVDAYLIGRVFAALLYQRSVLMFHASAIATETGTVLFAGPSGIGKSTLLAALLNRGYLLVSDDVAGVIRDAAGHLTVLPAFPSIRLHADVLDKVGWREREQTAVGEGSEKYRLPVERFHPSQMPLRAVYILTASDTQDVRIERLPISHTFRWLYESIYRKRILYGLGQQRTLFRNLTATSREIQVSLIERPRNSFLIDTLADRICADLRGEPLPAGNDAAAG